MRQERLLKPHQILQFSEKLMDVIIPSTEMFFKFSIFINVHTSGLLKALIELCSPVRAKKREKMRMIKYVSCVSQSD